MKLFIITGTSKGFGKEFAKICLNEGHQVVSVSRSEVEAHQHQRVLVHDLSDTNGLSEKFNQMLSKIDLAGFDEITLVNNAAVLPPFGSIEKADFESIQRITTVNFVVPTLLTSLFLKKLPTSIKRRVVNISSGAAFIPLLDWSMYCGTKAGLRMFTEVIAQDHLSDPNFYAVNFSPGIMDTNMQAEIRSQSPENFKRVEEFTKMKTEGKLLSPYEVAAALFKYLDSGIDQQKVNLDIKELQ